MRVTFSLPYRPWEDHGQSLLASFDAEIPVEANDNKKFVATETRRIVEAARGTVLALEKGVDTLTLRDLGVPA